MTNFFIDAMLKYEEGAINTVKRRRGNGQIKEETQTVLVVLKFHDSGIVRDTD